MTRITVGVMSSATAAEMRREWGAILRSKREELGLTQTALAELTELDQASVSRVEAGAGGFDSTIRCANALGVVLEVAS